MRKISITPAVVSTVVILVSLFILSSYRGTSVSAISGYQVVDQYSPVNNTNPKQVTCNCPTGKVAVGAGWSAEDNTGAILEGQATYFQPSYDGKSWLVNAKNLSTFSPNWKLHVRVLCADK